MIKNTEHKIMLRKKFEKEVGIEWINEQGEPDLDYVHWLEEKIPQNLQKADAYSLLGDGWRDARKEVPEIETEVLAYFSGAYCVMMRLKCTSPDGETKILWSDGNRSYIGVDAWRELPDPPSFA